MCAQSTKTDVLQIGRLSLSSRLVLGTGRYPSQEILLAALRASGTQMVTVAVRRVGFDVSGDSLYSALRADGYEILPNTACCYTAKDAVVTAELAREALGTDLIKLEVIGDEKTLLPDVGELLIAARELVQKGFVVLPYTNDDLITALRLQDAGCAAVMPLGAPIGSGLGIRNPHNMAIIKERLQVPVIVDAGVGTASDVAVAFELGCDAVLLNTAVAGAQDPVRMASAMRHASIAGREAFRAGRIARRAYATASSPTDGIIQVAS